MNNHEDESYRADETKADTDRNRNGCGLRLSEFSLALQLRKRQFRNQQLLGVGHHSADHRGDAWRKTAYAIFLFHPDLTFAATCQPNADAHTDEH